jgi:hypothetical protein
MKREMWMEAEGEKEKEGTGGGVSDLNALDGRVGGERRRVARRARKSCSLALGPNGLAHNDSCAGRRQIACNSNRLELNLTHFEQLLLQPLRRQAAYLTGAPGAAEAAVFSSE